MKDISTSEDDSNLLVLIIDTNPLVWAESSKAPVPLSLDDALRQILIFINAHLALKYNNKVVVIASHVGHSEFLYPVSHDVQSRDVQIKRNANIYPNFQFVADQIVSSVRELFSNADSSLLHKDMGASSMITGALSMALCYINRIIKSDELGQIKPRILVLSVSPDSAYQYIPLMNCIFSAQKAGIPVDVCKIYGEETAFLQQAANISGGVYLKVENTQALLQYLMFAFLPERYARNFLNLPNEDEVDFRAACFCHKKVVDIGYVCSVCLSIFCSWSPVCSTCKTKFAFRPLMPPQGGRSRAGTPRSTPSLSVAASPAHP
ncbi:TFIIH subunit Tfb4/p34 [Radiomyces spectabilis]|uniref:TFIIH subunit Tfb4/p34 n=1 Tax=Radiomyces spectabilis TaxID=64574 RepID=UPI00221E5AAE|nr:TFIIH subunit Tfb4/p34 [Radiomyces spectabilis]KAI8388390.1 TFIIH subunit Tfb4/p34 [Radiomyces spectabilis]